MVITRNTMSRWSAVLRSDDTGQVFANLPPAQHHPSHVRTTPTKPMTGRMR